VLASGDRGRGRPRMACGRGRWGTQSEGREEKGGGGIRGVRSRRIASDRRKMDGTRIETGCRVVQENLWDLGSGFKGSRAQRKTT
jgi:hypothetical protein